MTDEEAVHEVGWVAARAREIVAGRLTQAQTVDYYERKAALLEHIAEAQDGDEGAVITEQAAEARRTALAIAAIQV